jgi:hypothetical protein
MKNSAITGKKETCKHNLATSWKQLHLCVGNSSSQWIAKKCLLDHQMHSMTLEERKPIPVCTIPILILHSKSENTHHPHQKPLTPHAHSIPHCIQQLPGFPGLRNPRFPKKF